VRVVIAEDSVLLREGLARLFALHDIEVVAAVGDAATLLDAVEEHRPDLLVADVRMPPGFPDEGLRAALQVRRQWPQVGVLVLSQYVEERYATKLLAGHTTSTSSSPRPAGSRTAAPYSIPKWCRSCRCAAPIRWSGSRPASTRCSR